MAPFAKSKLLHSKVFALIRDFNFYYLPKAISFHTDIDREYTYNELRNKTTDSSVHVYPTYTKLFNWTRTVGVKWDLTQSLKVDFQASTLAVVDEPRGSVTDYDAVQRDSLRRSIMELGRKTNYNQKLNVNYNIPINKVPFFDWITANAVYSADYHWSAPALSLIPTEGNTIENTCNKQLNATANFSTLYNKIPYLKKLFQTEGGGKNQKTNPYSRYKNEGANNKSQKGKSHNQNADKIDSLKGQIENMNKQITTLNKQIATLTSLKLNSKEKNKTDSLSTKITTLKKEVTDLTAKIAALDKQISKLEKQKSILRIILNTTLRLLTSVKNVSVAYTQTNGMLLPGFTATPGALGNNWDVMVPGWALY